MLSSAGLEFPVFKSGNSVTCADQVFVTFRSDETSSDSLTFQRGHADDTAVSFYRAR